MGLLSKGAYLAAMTAIAVGILFGSSIPTRLGLYRFMASRSPATVGLTPAHSYGVPWNFDPADAYYQTTMEQHVAGHTAIVTGANSGVGYAMARAVAKQGATTVLACRSLEKCEAAVERIRAEHPSIAAHKVQAMVLDTASLASVQAFVRTYLSRSDIGVGVDNPLDMLFLNAGGLYAVKDTTCVPPSVDGIEQIFAGNYLGHHLLFRLLEPSLAKSKMARVVSTASAASFDSYTYQVATDLETLNGCSEPYSNQGGFPNLSYGQSKLAQIVWSKAVTARLGPSSTILVNAFHPGAVASEIWRKGAEQAESPARIVSVMEWFKDNVMWTPDEGALTGLYLGTAVDRLLRDNVRGKYFHPQSVEVINPVANNVTLQDKLWDFSEELVKDYLGTTTTKEEGKSVD